MAFLSVLRTANRKLGNVEHFLSSVGSGLADVNAADRKAARAAVRPQLINTLAKAGELRWTDDINPSPKNKQYKRVLDMHKDMLAVPEDIHLPCKDLNTSVQLCFYRHVANVVIVSSLVDKNTRESVTTVFDMKHLKEQNVRAVQLSNSCAPFLRNLAQLCCASHQNVLFLLDIQQWKADVSLRLKVSAAHDGPSEVQCVLKRATLGLGQLFKT